jgi:hypothetical protein
MGLPRLPRSFVGQRSSRLHLEQLEDRIAPAQLTVISALDFTLSGGNLYHITGAQQQPIDTAVEQFAVVNNKVYDLHMNGALESMNYDGSGKVQLDSGVKSLAAANGGLYALEREGRLLYFAAGSTSGAVADSNGTQAIVAANGGLYDQESNGGRLMFFNSGTHWSVADYTPGTIVGVKDGFTVRIVPPPFRGPENGVGIVYIAACCEEVIPIGFAVRIVTLPSRGPENGVNATSAELTQAATVSDATAQVTEPFAGPSLGYSLSSQNSGQSGTQAQGRLLSSPPTPEMAAAPSPSETSATVSDATAQVTGPFAAGYSLSSQNSGQNGTQVQGWLLSSPPTPEMAAAPSPSEPRSFDPHAILPNLLPPLELTSQSEQEASDPQSLMSALEACPRQLLAALGPQCQKAAPLPPPDLPALEAGLLQLLAELGETSVHLAEIEYGTVLRIWLLVAAGAGVACAVARGQQRRFAGVFGTDIPPLFPSSR